MSILSYVKKNNFLISKRDFQCDYSIHPKALLDMSLSGAFFKERAIPKDLLNVRLDQYPPFDDEKELRFKISQKYKVPLSCIVLGNGANGIFQNLMKIFFKERGNLVTPFLSFSQPEYCVTSLGSYTKRVFMTKEFKIDFDSLKNSIDKKTKAVFICNPNNPTGLYENPKKIIQFAESIRIPVIVSEASIDFSEKDSLLNFSLPKNLIIVRSFSKTYGLAGIRLGYAIMDKEYCLLYRKSIPQFEISTISLILGNKYFQDSDVKKNINKTIQERKFLEVNLKRIGISVFESSSNILMSQQIYTTSFFQTLIKNGICVVPVMNQLGKFHFRVAVQKHEKNVLFIKKIEEIIKRNIINE